MTKMTITDWAKRERKVKEQAMKRRKKKMIKFISVVALSLMVCFFTLSLLLSAMHYWAGNANMNDHANTADAHGWSEGTSGYDLLDAEREAIANKDVFFGWCYRMGKQGGTAAIRDLVIILIGFAFLASIAFLVLCGRYIYMYKRYKTRKEKEARLLARQVNQNKRLFGI